MRLSEALSSHNSAEAVSCLLQIGIILLSLTAPICEVR